MSLRKNPVTPARLEANRRNSQKSTGPRTARGKAQVRMNALRAGDRSRLLQEFGRALFDAPFGGVERAARELLMPELARHRLFAVSAEVAVEADRPDQERLRQINAMFRGKRKKGFPNL